MARNKIIYDHYSGEPESEPGWIVTFADLVTLLLVYFVLLFSISSMDLEKFREIARALQNSFGAESVSIVEPEPDSKSISEEIKDNIEKVQEEILSENQDALDRELLWDVQEFVKKKKVGDNIVIYEEKDRITITFEGRALFDSGQAELLPEASPLLDDIFTVILNNPKYAVNIKGHTDDRPISTAQFPSNWELSAVRATTVLRYLASMGVDPNRLTATGYGSLLPIAPNDSPKNRAKNRRVEFVLEKKR